MINTLYRITATYTSIDGTTHDVTGDDRLYADRADAESDRTDQHWDSDRDEDSVEYTVEPVDIRVDIQYVESEPGDDDDDTGNSGPYTVTARVCLGGPKDAYIDGEWTGALATPPSDVSLVPYGDTIDMWSDSDTLSTYGVDVARILGEEVLASVTSDDITGAS